MPYADKQKQKEFQKMWKRRKRDWLWRMKDALSCVECGASHPAIIQFHHKDKNKESDISKMVDRNCSEAVILAEIAKCEILCANCHAILHYEQSHKLTRIQTGE